MSVRFSDEEDSTQSSANGTENNINTNQLSVNSTQQVKLSFTVGVVYIRTKLHTYVPSCQTGSGLEWAVDATFQVCVGTQ